MPSHFNWPLLKKKKTLTSLKCGYRLQVDTKQRPNPLFVDFQSSKPRGPSWSSMKGVKIGEFRIQQRWFPCLSQSSCQRLCFLENVVMYKIFPIQFRACDAKITLCHNSSCLQPGTHFTSINPIYNLNSLLTLN